MGKEDNQTMKRNELEGRGDVNPHEEIKSTGKGKYVSKFKRQMLWNILQNSYIDALNTNIWRWGF